jgi:hypothetical protein
MSARGCWYTSDNNVIDGAGARPELYRGAGYKACRTCCWGAYSFWSAWCVRENRRTARQRAWCHSAYLQLAQNPDETRQESDETLAGERKQPSTNAMREGLSESHLKRRARVHVLASDWPNSAIPRGGINASVRSSTHAQCLVGW